MVRSLRGFGPITRPRFYDVAPSCACANSAKRSLISRLGQIKFLALEPLKPSTRFDCSCRDVFLGYVSYLRIQMPPPRIQTPQPRVGPPSQFRMSELES